MKQTMTKPKLEKPTLLFFLEGRFDFGVQVII